MKYRAWREYRDRYPELVLLTPGDLYPVVTRTVEQVIPREVRARTRPADIVRAPRDTAWCMAQPGETYVVYDMAGSAVDVDLTGDRGAYRVTWLDASRDAEGREAPAVTAGDVVTLAPPERDTGRPWVAWLSRAR